MVANLLRTCFNAGRRIGLLVWVVINYKVCNKGSDGYSPDEHIHARLHAFLNVTLFCKGTQCHNRGRVAHFTNESGALQAIQVWHLKYLVTKGFEVRGESLPECP